MQQLVTTSCRVLRAGIERVVLSALAAMARAGVSYSAADGAA
ncbi:MAG: hypothetical protein OQL06_08140 [Gammaproteobacteria bacterium]|nr:hypothetical protein [Gammaproteobacteria bacterium]